MSREEAIKYLNEFILFKKISNITEEEAVECFELAVEALQQQPSDDCISREAALNIIKHICFSEEYVQFRADYGSNGQRDTVITYIKALPSVTPQQKERTEERTETHECDYISRQLMYDMGATCIATRNKDGDLVALGALDILPSATPQPKEEPQQKTGHWIEHKHGGIEHIECSECGIWFLKANLIRKSYCPNCGSCNGDMIKNIMRDIANNNGGVK